MQDLRYEPDQTAEPEPEPEPELEPGPESRTMWLAPRVSSHEAIGDVSPSLASTFSPRAQSPSGEIGVRRRDMPAEVARLATALRQEVLRREAVEAQIAAAEAAHQKFVEDARAKRLEDAAVLAHSQQQHSLLRAQLTATATESRRLSAREESMRVEHERLQGQVETLQLRVAAVSTERDRLLRKLSESQALIDKAKAGEAVAVKLASQKTMVAQAALAAKSREVDEMESELSSARRRAELAERDARTASATASEVSRELYALRKRNLATAMKIDASQRPRIPVAPPALQNSTGTGASVQLNADSNIRATAHPD